MSLRFSGLVAVSVGLSFAASVMAAAAFSDAQVSAFVEALRQNAPPQSPNDQLYSDWQIKPENIPRWAKFCTGKALSPAQFEANPAIARSILVCVTRDVLRDELQKSNNQETAIRRAAAWWMTGDPNRYNSDTIATYTQKVLASYQKQQAAPTSSTTGPNSSSPTQSPKPDTATSTPAPARNVGTPYDRYMKAGYAASQKKDYSTAKLYFQRALDERPNDTYAQQAIQNVETFMNGNQSTRPTPSAASSAVPPAASETTAAASASSLTEPQAIALITEWLQAKAEIFAPPFNQQRATELTSGELYASLLGPDGVLPWLKSRQAYYRYGVQKVESVQRFVVNGDRATIEVKLTEDRTLYLNGAIDPKQTDFSAQQVRYSLERANDRWKIADYKTTDGSLLERSILNANPSSEQRLIGTP